MLTSRTWTVALLVLALAFLGCEKQAPASAEAQGPQMATPMAAKSQAVPTAVTAKAAAAVALPTEPAAARPAASVKEAGAPAWTDVTSAGALDKLASASKVSVVLVKGEGAADVGPVTKAIDRLRARLASGGKGFAPYAMSAKAEGADKWMASTGVKGAPAVVFVGGGNPPLVVEGDLSEAQLAKAFMKASRSGGSPAAPSCGGGGGAPDAPKCGCGG